MSSKNEVKGQQDGTCEMLAARRAANSSNGIKTRTLTPSPGDGMAVPLFPHHVCRRPLAKHDCDLL